MRYKPIKKYNVNKTDNGCWDCYWKKRGAYQGCNNNHYCINHDKHKKIDY